MPGRRTSIILSLILLSLLCVQATYSQMRTVANSTDTLPFVDAQNVVLALPEVPDETGNLIVRVAHGQSLDGAAAELAAHGYHVADRLPALGRLVVRPPAPPSGTVGVQSVEEAVLESTLIDEVESETFYQIASAPNDPDLDRQDAVWKRLGAYEAWAITPGSAQVIVAVLDTGVDCNHPDLAGKCVPGIDLVNSDSDPSDDHGHGTHVAGTVAALTNNGVGGAGMCPQCRVMPIKVLNSDGSGPTSLVSRAIVHAVDNGAQVINMSLGGSSSSAVQDAVDYAWSRGVVVVAAAGNNGSTNPQYPAGYTNSIAVAATDTNDRIASFSNRGNWVDVTAPGVQIYSTVPGNRYSYASGTSMAAPHVAGLAGLMAAHGLNHVQIRDQLFSSAVKISGTGQHWQHGRVDAFAAVQGAATTPPPVDNPAPDVPPTDSQNERVYVPSVMRDS